MDEFNYSICWPNGADFSPDYLYENGLDFDIKKPIKSSAKIKHKGVFALEKKRPTPKK